MGDLLGIASSGLSAAQKGLELTGQNISNVNSPHYSRQRVDQSARANSSVSKLATGDGVVVNGTQRLNDALVESRLVRDGAEVSRLDAFSGLAGRVDTLMSDSSSGLSSSLSSFFKGLDQLAADPGSTAARQAALAQVDSLSVRFGSLYAELKSVDHEIDQRLTAAVSSINDQTAALAKLNHSIASSRQNPPADLLDQRDQLVQNIAAQVGITTVAQDDGSLNVFSSSGQPLVVGDKAMALTTADDLYRPGRVDIMGGTARITTQLSGGAIGGLLDARRNLVDPALEKLGRVAVSLTSRVNAVQAQGITQDGSVGTAVFADISGTALAARTNTGNASVQAGFSNLSAVTGEDMILRYNGSQWQMSNARSGQSVAFTGTGTTADPLQAGGMSLTLSGTANAGDSFSISPTHDAAGAVQRIAVDGSAFATAGRLSAAASLSNLGTVSIAAPAVSDASNPQLTTPVSISFLSAGSFQIGSGAAQAYTSGSSISANGWSLTLTGTPQAGDRFTVSPTGVGSSDNRNANALAGIASEKLLDAGRSTLSAANNALVTQTGSVAQQASVAKDAADAVRTQSQKERDSVSGVNLDEEAANLVRYQQAYQAAAQVIATAGTVFESVLAATRR